MAWSFRTGRARSDDRRGLRREGIMIFDCDSHIMPKDVFDYLDSRFAAKAPRMVFDANGLFVDIDFPSNAAHRVPGATPLPVGHVTHGLGYRGNTDMAARLADYDTIGAAAHFALPQLTGWWNYVIDPEFGSALAHSWNLALLKQMRAYPNQVLGVALVALHDVPGAVKEMEWAMAEGFKAIMLDFVYPVAEHPYGTTLAAHAELWPFFRRAEELNVPIFLHAVQHGHRLVNFSRFREYGLDLLAPGDAQLNLITLITSGLLDDFPKLQFIHAEIGTACIIPLLKQMDSRHERIPIRFDEEGFTAVSRRKEILPFREMRMVPPTVMRERNQKKPSHYFKNNFYWTIETEESELADAIDLVGADRFLFAADYPHNDPGGRMKFKDVELLRANP
ncbi:MAG: hypothetical protein FJX52_10840, partial [Alphaproteobacteria bacterium]|nr:hypothetical protein [Alphaproteobacteria bacterium]